MVDAAKSKMLLTVNAVYNNGIALCSERKFVADTRIIDTKVPAFRVIEIRFVVPTRDAEDLQDALRRGDAELLIQDIPPKV